MYEFNTPDPVRLRIEFGAGDIAIEATDTDRTTVQVSALRDDEVSREAAAETRVEQHGRDVVVEAPRRSGFLRRGPHLKLRVRIPSGSDLEAKTESADLTSAGWLNDVSIKTGSGDLRLETVTGDTSIQSGSGDVEIDAAGNVTRLQSGSGDLRLGRATGSVNARTGSGDIAIDEVSGPLQANSGSGDLRVGSAEGDVSVNTASGDQYLGRVVAGQLRCNAASGDVRIGIAEGTAAWLSVNSLSGSVRSELNGSEPPAADEPTVEVRVNTVSGDIELVRA